MYKLEAELAPLLQDMQDFNVQKWDFTVKFVVDESRRNMYGSTFKVVDSCLSDRGFFTCLYTMEEGVTIEQVAQSVGFGIYHRQVVRCTPPIGKKMGQKITTQVLVFFSLGLSLYKFKVKMYE